jgi:hypothetical protein
MQRDAPPSLRAMQAAFAAALDARDPVTQVCGDLFGADGGAPVDARFAVYQNNTRVFFSTALERSFPVVQRRVGSEAFAQLAAAYRAAHPSQRGDLHYVGAAFPAWLAHRFDGTEFAWLADLARLEWACELAVIAAAHPPLTSAALAVIAPGHLEHLRFALQPSLQLVESPFPVWSVWQANQGTAGAAVDLAAGPEHCAVACLGDRPVVYRVPRQHFAVVAALRDRHTLGDALDASDADASLLQSVLGWLFEEQLVVGLT